LHEPHDLRVAAVAEINGEFWRRAEQESGNDADRYGGADLCAEFVARDPMQSATNDDTNHIGAEPSDPSVTVWKRYSEDVSNNSGGERGPGKYPRRCRDGVALELACAYRASETYRALNHALGTDRAGTVLTCKPGISMIALWF